MNGEDRLTTGARSDAVVTVPDWRHTGVRVDSKAFAAVSRQRREQRDAQLQEDNAILQQRLEERARQPLTDTWLDDEECAVQRGVMAAQSKARRAAEHAEAAQKNQALRARLRAVKAVVNDGTLDDGEPNRNESATTARGPVPVAM